jgi:putative colanic acid biosynthesis acetyltransferase WcaF
MARFAIAVEPETIHRTPHVAAAARSQVRLDRYSARSFRRGRSLLGEATWLVAQALILASPLPGSRLRAWLLRRFGAHVGQHVTIKPGLRVKFPWRLHVGDHSWIGEDVWIDNLADVRIGDHCCISQGVYLCTGNHDWSRPSFDLVVQPISIESQCWLAARSVVGPGVTVQEGAVLGLGSVAARDLEAWQVHVGTPAAPVRPRVVDLLS